MMAMRATEAATAIPAAGFSQPAFVHFDADQPDFDQFEAILDGAVCSVSFSNAC
jgi:hypothetical protein